MRKLVALGLLVAMVGCAEDSNSELPADLLAGDETFVAVKKPASEEVVEQARQALGSSPVGVSSDADSFYLAIKKSDLDKRWFLSAYMKQLYPLGPSIAAASTLGTRVVSFKVQNGKLFIFDVGDGHNESQTFSPEILVEAYPIVTWHPFDALGGSNRYILIDPSAGLNKFGVTGDIYQDFWLTETNTSFPLSIGLSYLQNFRAIDGGATYEQVFTGLIPGSPEIATTWAGTLGISFRRYFEGAGYTITPDPGIPHYFLSNFRALTDSGGFYVQNPVKWNLHPGMKPIQWKITAGAKRAQADFPDVDLLGAFKRGIEDWNDVLGFKAFEAKISDDEDFFARDDVNALIVDYPGSGAGFAFADWRSNPNTGETRGGSIFFDGAFVGIIPFLDDDPPAATAIPAPKARPNGLGLSWGGMAAPRPLCTYQAPDARSANFARIRADKSLTAQEKGSRYIQHVVTHEMGHVLGLRHNFEGSLLPPSSSVMDYLDDFTDAIATPTPQSYDQDAVRYLYDENPDLPAQPFCTDEDTLVDSDCQRFDSTADPLNLWHGPFYHDPLAFLVLDLGFPPSILDALRTLNAILGYVRVSLDPSQAVSAMQIALDRTAVPVSAADAATPGFAEASSGMAMFVLSRLWFDSANLRFPIAADPTDPSVFAYLNDQVSGMIANADGVRTFPLRRLGVDVLKKMQDVGSYVALRAARDAVAAQLAGGGVDVPLTEDLLARIDAALSPYFN